MALPSKSQINRLGDRLAHEVSDEDTQRYFALRSEYAEALAMVEQTVAATLPGAHTHDLRPAPHSGYRAVHLIVEGVAGLPVAVPVRTEVRERWARISEKLMDRYGADVKYGGGPAEVRSRLDELSARAWDAERGVLRTRVTLPDGRVVMALVPSERILAVWFNLVNWCLADPAPPDAGD